MGREVRRVPKDWEHPKDDMGNYLPLYDGAEFAQKTARWDEAAQKWTEGLFTDYRGGWVPLSEEQRGEPYSEWGPERPDPKEFMPIWKDDERTHFMMYEDTSDGTPISPAFATIEELAHWLADNNVEWFGDETTTYEGWLSIIENSTHSLPSVISRNK